MSEPSVFGDVDGIAPGRSFLDREAVRASGLHRHLQAGISGRYEDGADAIVVSGGYVDDRDEGDWILYTGQGGRDSRGRQIRDQTLTRGNRALVLSEERGLPVRVIRGAGGDERFSPASGYRYDGLYAVERHFVEASLDGPLVFRYELRRISGGGVWPPISIAVPAGVSQPVRNTSVVQRVVRNTAVTQYVKQLYDYACQICGVRLELGAGAYAEGAHIRPLGGRHAGSDTVENVLCLCPNDHILFDKGVLRIETDMTVLNLATGARVPLVLRHAISAESIQYHASHIAGANGYE